MNRINLSFSINYQNKAKNKKQKLKKNALDNVDFEEEKRKDPKYKTELCKSFMENNFCKYGNKCRFAHGEKELVIKEKNVNYKKKLCKSFYNEGFCTYGIRCNFQHDQRKITDIQLSFYNINLLAFHKPKLVSGKRLKIFEEISNMENTLSESTISSSIDNSPNLKKTESFKEFYLEKNISEFYPYDNYKKMNIFNYINFNKVYKNEEEYVDENNISNNENSEIIDENIFNFDFIDISSSYSDNSEKEIEKKF